MRRASLYVLGGILSVQFGAAIAKDLFERIDPTSMVFLRLASSAILFVLIARPVLRGRSREDWAVVIGFGLCLGLMNWAIYQSFARIPLGIAVTIEFIGPLSVALFGSRRLRDFAWVGLAAIGVIVLGFEPHGVTLAGVLFALLAAAAWGAYILLSAATGQRWQGLDGLAVASVIAMLALLPLAIPAGGTELFDPEVLALGAAIGLLSTVIPYSLELIALRQLKPSVFGILMSLEPAAAAGAAMLVLGEFLQPIQWVAVACVIVASIGATWTGQSVHAEPVPD